MTSDVIIVEPDADVREVARRLLDNRISAVPVIDQSGTLVGIVSEGDLMRRAETGAARRPSWWLALFGEPDDQARAYIKTHGRRAADVMSRPVITVEENTSLEEVADLLQKRRIKRVPVLRDGRLVGIVSRADLLHGLVARQGGAPATEDDRAIRAAVVAGLEEAGVSRRFLNIVVSGGVVHIWGVVETAEEREAIRVAAEGAPGAKEVRLNVDALPASAQATLWPD